MVCAEDAEEMAADVLLKESYAVARGNFNAAGDASSAIKEVLKRVGISTAIVRRVAIASYEAELNIIIHSSGGRILLAVSRDKIVLTAEDDGPGIPDIAQAMTEGFSTAPESVRQLGFGAGMGLSNMQRCADDFFITSAPETGTCITMGFDVR